MNARKFRNWVKRHNGNVSGDSGLIQKALNGDVGAIWYAFIMDETPQRHDFWLKRMAGEAKISKRSRRFLAKLRDEAKRNGW